MYTIYNYTINNYMYIYKICSINLLGTAYVVDL